MAHDAGARGMRIMLGCMVESTLGIAALAQLAPAADYVDLDGAALLSDDPFAGVAMRDGMLYLSSEPGLGVRLREGISTRGWDTADVAPA
jgi:L-alanine-DL-glutamate epimerase-like enolase superfamily enzyme